MRFELTGIGKKLILALLVSMMFGARLGADATLSKPTRERSRVS